MSLEMVSVIVGMLMPPVVSVVVRSTWPAWAKGLAALGSSVVLGVATAWLSGQLTGVDVATAVAVVLLASQAAYRLWWQPTGIGPAIERATQPAIEGEVTSSETVPVDAGGRSR